MSGPAVELSTVSKEYPGDPPTPVLFEVNLSVARGELVAVVGPSGSGKSTLFNVIGMLDRPTSGSIRIAGHDTADLDDDSLSALRAREIGFVFQHFHLLPGRTALDNVADGLLYTGRPKAERQELGAEALNRVGLEHRIDSDSSKLSGGERQRVAIARAFVGRPSLLLADEPTGNLDSRSSESILALLHDLNQGGATILVITHDREISAAFPRRIGIRDGRIESDTSTGLRP